MSGLLGGGSGVSTSAPIISSMRLQTSTRGKPIPLAYGLTKIAPNLIHYADFLSTAHTENSSGGGKGGGGGPTNTTYTYDATVLLGLCEGAINSIPRIWRGKSVYEGGFSDAQTFTAEAEGHLVAPDRTITLNNSSISALNTVYVESAWAGWGSGGRAELIFETDYNWVSGAVITLIDPALIGKQVWVAYEYQIARHRRSALDQVGLELFAGSYQQNAFTYMQSKHADQALAYRGLAYAAGSKYDLGDSATLENHSFEIDTQSGFSSTIRDASAKDIIVDFLTNPTYGAGFPAATFGDLDMFHRYCVANNLFFSPAYLEQAPAQEMLSKLMLITNSGIVYSEGKLKILPYGDVSASANGLTYTPNLSPVYDLTDDDFLGDSGGDPIKVVRKSSADAYNQVQVKFYNRANSYNEEVVEAKDQANIELYGLRAMDAVECYEICEPAIARQVAQLMLQRALYIRNSYEFKLGWSKCLLEPMDLVTLTDPGLGFLKTPARIVSIEENEDGELDVVAEEFPLNVCNAALYHTQGTAGYQTNYNTVAGNVAPPVIFEPPKALANGKLQVWCAVTGLTDMWGGCTVWVSLDGNSYKRFGEVLAGARYGLLSTALGDGAGDGFNVSLSGKGGQLIAGTLDEAKVGATLCLVGDEYLAYSEASLLGANSYRLGGLVRAMNGSVKATHLSATRMVRIDDTIFKSEDLNDSYPGKTLHFKFTSVNVFGGGAQSLADVPSYSYKLQEAVIDTPSPGSVSTGGPLAIDFELTEAGMVILTVKSAADPTIKNYEIRDYSGTTFPESKLFATSDEQCKFYFVFSEVLGKSFRVHAVYRAGGYGLKEGVIAFTAGGLPAITSVDWSIEEPYMKLVWPAIAEATQYAVYVEEGGVTRFIRQRATELRILIPKYSLNVRVIAVAADGRVSSPFDKSLGVTGSYKLNEIVNIPISTNTGTYVGMAHLGNTAVERPDLLGPSQMIFPITDQDSASLYALGYNLENTPGTAFENIPGTWFRDGFWRVKNGYYESAPYDFGMVLTGTVKASLTKVVEYHGGAGSNFERVLGDYLAEFTGMEMEDQAAFLSAKLYITSDPPQAANWTEVIEGQPVAGRYVKLVVEALSVGPLTRVRVTAGAITLDVPDISQTAKVTMNTGSMFIGLTKFNVVTYATATPNLSAKTWITNVTKDGFTLNTDSNVFPIVMNYFVKGY